MTSLVNATAPYAALARVYERWTAGNDYDSWVAYLREQFAEAQVKSVLDVCCGTGTIADRLQQLGYQVTGVDGSAEMLAAARGRLAPGTTLIHADLPGGAVPPGEFDAAICTFDSVNYFVEEGALSGLLRYVATALRAGGIFIFDVNTRVKLQEVFGDSHYGDDLGDFAYVWRNRHTPEQHRTDFLITLFERGPDGMYARSEERHAQRWFAADEIREAARTAGFTVLATTDDYSERPAGAQSLREVWVLRRTEN